MGGRGRKAGGRHPRGGIGPGAVAPVLRLLRLRRLRWLMVGVVGGGGRGLAEDVGEGPAEVLAVLGEEDLWVVVVCGRDKYVCVRVMAPLPSICSIIILYITDYNPPTSCVVKSTPQPTTSPGPNPGP